MGAVRLGQFDGTSSVLINTMPDVTTVAVSGDGGWLASGSTDGAVRIWRISTGNCVAALRVAGTINDLSWSPDQRSVGAAGEGGLYLLDLRDIDTTT